MFYIDIEILTMTNNMTKPKNKNFGSGPCAKRPGWNGDFLLKSNLLGRSHRSKEVMDLILDVESKTRKLLNLPDDYYVAIMPASDTGAFEAAMWNMLGQRAIDVIHQESFSKGWYVDIIEQLKLKNIREFAADFGKVPDVKNVNFDNDVIFTLNGTTSGVCFNDLSFIPTKRDGLVFCDATSAAFAMPIDFSKVDVFTYSWQKALGGEAQHGVLVLSPKAAERLNSYAPQIPIPKIFQIAKNGKFSQKVFQGSVINTPSVMCILDIQDTLNWLESIGGRQEGFDRVEKNCSIMFDFLENSKYFKNLCDEEQFRSKTSVCFTCKQNWFVKLDKISQQNFIDKVCAFLAKNQIAYDIKGYSEAPPSFRVWCGITIETDDLKHLCNWLNYAYETIFENL